LGKEFTWANFWNGWLGQGGKIYRWDFNWFIEVGGKFNTFGKGVAPVAWR